jgi:hypothetical protein
LCSVLGATSSLGSPSTIVPGQTFNIFLKTSGLILPIYFGSSLPLAVIETSIFSLPAIL